jgi:ATP/maltotriose-dependent transcriptional regulator MalT
LRLGDWQAARSAFEQAIAVEESPEAYEGLGQACWWLDEQDATIKAREASYRLYRARGEARNAARVATLVGLDHGEFRGDFAVASGWMQRAESLLRDSEPSAELGWLRLYQGFMATFYENRLDAAHALGEAGAAIGRQVGSFDIEMMAVALHGLILIREGRVGEGVKALDEAMTAAVGGEMSDLAAIGNTCCTLIYACEAIADYDRAAQWCERTREFCRRMGMDLFVFDVCRNYYATMLIWRGAWEQADAELTAAMRGLETRRPSDALESLVRLAELRRRQGRIEEAQAMFARAEPHRRALFGQAALALDRGDAETAVDLLQRVLRRIGAEDQAERVFTLELLARARLQAGDVEEARAALAELEATAVQVGTQPLLATADAVRGAIALAHGDAAAAQGRLEDAIDVFEACEAHFDAARVRLDYAQALEMQGRVAPALEQAMTAQDGFKRLGAALYADRAGEAVARLSKGLGRPPSGAALPHGLTSREAEVLWLIAAGKTNQDIASELVLSVRTVERHITTVYEKLGLHGRSARAAAAALAAGMRANT